MRWEYVQDKMSHTYTHSFTAVSMFLERRKEAGEPEGNQHGYEEDVKPKLQSKLGIEPGTLDPENLLGTWPEYGREKFPCLWKGERKLENL